MDIACTLSILWISFLPSAWWTEGKGDLSLLCLSKEALCGVNVVGYLAA